METLGLGVRLNFDDNMTSEINPLIRDLERLRNSAQRTTQTFDNMSTSYNPFNGQRRRDVNDYRDSIQSTDRALLNISDRLIRATQSASNLSNAMNRMQFRGSFGQMYSDLSRVQRMLGNMGFGMSRMQRDMAQNSAFTLMDNQMKDLKDRIKLTQQALREMQNSPDSHRFRNEMDLARRSLMAYQSQLARAGNLQQRLADTHGYGLTQSRGNDVLYEQAKSNSDAMRNMLLGASMADMALASSIAYNSIDKTGRMMVGLGYTTSEAKMKLMQLSGQLMTTGMALTQFGTVPVAIATVGLGLLVSKWEEASNVFHARTLMNPEMFKDSARLLRDISVDTGATQIETSGALAVSYNKYGETKGMDYAGEQAKNALFMYKIHGVQAEKSISDVDKIMTTFGVDSKKAWDMYAAGAMEAKKQTGKGFTGQSGIDRIMETIESSPDKYRNATSAMGEYNGAFEKMVGNYEKGVSEQFTESLGEAGSAILAVFETVSPMLEKLFGGVKKVMQVTRDFLRDNEGISKIIGYTTMLALGFLALIGPVALGTAFMIQYRNVIKGVAMAVAGFNKGGLALLPPQAKMAMNATKALTVSMARLPQTLLFGALPAMYTFIRGLPLMALNMMKLNPLFTGLTLGVIAYKNNFLGLGDTVDKAMNRVKTAHSTAKSILAMGMEGSSFNIESYGGMTQVFAKVMGTAQLAKKVLTSIFGGTDLEFSTGEINLMQQLGIEGLVYGIANGGKAVKDFWDGFKDGIMTTLNAVKTFAGWMYETFKPIITFIGDGILNTINGLSKMFGGKGDLGSFEDIISSASTLKEEMFDLGKIAGTLLTSLLGFKILKSVFGAIKNPFSGIISSARIATGVVGTMGRAIRNVGGNPASRTVVAPTASPVVGGTSANGRLTGLSRYAQFRNSNGRQAQADRNNLGVRHRDYQNMTPAQQANHDRRLTNTRAQLRGNPLNPLGAGRNAMFQNGTHNGSTVHARRTGVFRRALFGQAYDTYDSQGRRREVNRQGGLLRSTASDANITNRGSLRERVGQSVSQTATNVGRGVASATAGVRATVGNATSGIRSGASNVASRAVNSRAMRPVTVPVRYVMGRLQTAGIIRQGTQSGRQSGGLFRRAFQTATRGMRVTASVAGGAVGAGRRAGAGVVRGFGGVARGIGGVFKLGFKLIPFLGWALMAWDIISAIFTNWDSIKSGAIKAWNWISTKGVSALLKAWDKIKHYAGVAWDWILTNGKDMVIKIGNAVISFLGKAFTFILKLAGDVFIWILTDGIKMAIKLGVGILKWIGEAFTKIVPWALGKFGEIVGAVWEIGKSIGSSIFEAIKSGFGDIGSYIGGKVSGAWEGVKGFFGGGNKTKNVPQYARGGIISSPHMGIVGEAGPEAIIPLSGNQRDRARGLLQRTAGILGVAVKEPTQTDHQLDDSFPAQVSAPVRNNVVRRGGGNNVAPSSSGGSQDNSVTIQNFNLHVKDSKDISEVGGRKHAIALMKELQKIMKQERIRSNGKNLTLEDVILNM